MKRTYTKKPGESRTDYLNRAAKFCQRLYDAGAAAQDRGEFCGHWSHGMTLAMLTTERAFTDLGTFGVEGVCRGNGEGHYDCLYLNAGDAYAITLLCGESPVVEVGSWGDFMEVAEQADNEENGTISCAYCGHHTPLTDGAEWRDTVCESCGWYVDGRGKAPVGAQEED